jgi:hypothetical protein
LFSALADILYIYPNKRNKQSFDNKRDEILRNGLEAALNRPIIGDTKGKKFDGSPMKTGGGGASNDKSEEKFLRSLLEEEKRDVNVDLTKKLFDSIPSIKKRMKFYELNRVKLEIAEEVALAKRVEIDMNVEHWTKYLLFPFANIAPLPDLEDYVPPQVGMDVSESDKNFNKLVSKKYQFPISALKNMESSEGCLKELQNALTVTSEEISRDLLKFIKDFNVGLIPHMNEEEVCAYTTDKLKT